MHIIDILIFTVYMFFVLGIGIYFLKKNKNADDYYVGGRSMGSSVIGLSVVATDVGGGFSIGLGGLGFLMGLSGSWMLFTGLLGAWLSAVFLIPKASKLASRLKLYTFPQLFEFFTVPAWRCWQVLSLLSATSASPARSCLPAPSWLPPPLKGWR